MTWLRLDDGFAAHPKVAHLSPHAFKLHVSALCYCAQFLTDGFVPTARPGLLMEGYRPAQVTELVDAGLWEPAEGGYWLHDYLKYNPSREKVEAEREAARNRQLKHRRNGVTNAVTDGVTNGVSHGSPRHTTPSRPDPLTPLPPLEHRPGTGKLTGLPDMPDRDDELNRTQIDALRRKRSRL